MKTNRFFPLLIPVVVLLLFASCIREVAQEANDTQNSLTREEAQVLYWHSRHNKAVSYKEAEANVETLIDLFSENTRSGGKKRILNATVLPSSGGGSSTTRSGEVPADTAVYLFNFADNGGFAMISGDIRTERFLCFVEDGNLNPDEEITNPGLAIFLSHAEDALKAQKERADSLTNALLPAATKKADQLSQQSTGTRSGIYISLDDGVGPLLTTTWNQDPPYNKYCKTTAGELAYVGCVAVATAQIMAYWEKPSWKPWAAMKANTDDESIAMLMSEIGTGVYMNYAVYGGTEGSGASSSNVPVYLKSGSVGLHSGNLTNYSSESWETNGFKQQLDARRPIYMRGNAIKVTTTTTTTTYYYFLGICYKTKTKTSTNTAYEEGHAWVCDGYRTFSCNNNGVITTPILLHMNWGWQSAWYYNGYYNATCFDTNMGSVTRSGTSGYYQYNLQYIPGIYAIMPTGGEM